MKNKSKIFFLLAVVIIGIFWAYGISTRIGLLFIIPLWLKTIVMIGFGINFILLAYFIGMHYSEWQASKKTKAWLIAVSVLLTILIFIVLPYHSVPFRTTHTLSISAQDSDVKLVEVLSPDDNLVPRDDFEGKEGINYFDANGFLISSQSTLEYRRGQTGGLTLSFTADSGNAKITWDGDTMLISPQTILTQEQRIIDGWSLLADPETGRILVRLPGYTWGNPDLFWSILGALLPIGDFICLSSLILIILCLIVRLLKKTSITPVNGQLLMKWIDASVCLGLAMLLIDIGYPGFIPLWFLLFFLPAAAYLAFHQIQYLSSQFNIKLACSIKTKQIISWLNSFLTRFNQNKWTFWVLIILVALTGAFAQLKITAPGMGISGDSVHYMEGAVNLAAGNGYVRQIAEGDPVVQTGFPPVYPMALVPGIWLGIGVEVYARLLNTILLILTILLAGLIVFKASGKAFPSVWVTLFFVMAPPILEIYSWIMSEPLFLVLFLLSLFLLQWQINRPTLWKILLLGLEVGVMVNTRLAGIAFVPVLVLGVLLFQKTKFTTRLRDSVILTLVALAQPAAFFIRNSLIAGRVSESRGITFASFKHEYWEILLREIAGWFKWKSFFNFEYQQFNAQLITLGVIFLVIIGWIIFEKKLSVISKLDPTIIMLIISIPVYMAVIVLNTILFTPIQTVYGLSRYLIPILLILLLILGKLLSDYWRQPLLFQKLSIFFVLLVGLQLYIPDTVDFVREPYEMFRNYTDRRNECGVDLNQFMDELPNVSYLTNACEYFYLLTGKTCRHLSLDEADYNAGGEIYQAVQDGNIIAFSPDFGTNPPGIRAFLSTLDNLGYSCYLEFYQLPIADK